MPSICYDCAIKKGAEAIEGHICTHWTGKCSTCYEEKGCSDESDWQWPGRKRLMAEWD